MTRDAGLTPETIDALLGALNCGALLIDRSGVILHSNERFRAMVARPPEGVDGRPLESLYSSEEDVKLIRQRLEEFDAAFEAEFHVETSGGQQVPVIMSSRPLGGPGAPSAYKVVTVIDISGQKKMESRLTEDYQEISKLSDTVLEQALALKHHSQHLEQKVRERTVELLEANMEAIYMLAVASEAKDTDTGAHVRRIQKYTELIASEMGLPAATAEQFGYSAILHDVGKMIVPDAILKKPGRLTAEERKVIESHTLAGERILSSKPFFNLARQIARNHHENWNGSGYPDGLAGEKIPQAARIVRVVDVYDALLSPRVYKPAWTPENAADVIRKGRGEMFDPAVVAQFERVWDSRTFKEIAG